MSNFARSAQRVVMPRVDSHRRPLEQGSGNRAMLFFSARSLLKTLKGSSVGLADASDPACMLVSGMVQAASPLARTSV